MDFNLLREVSNLHNMNVTGKVEKDVVIQKALENMDGFAGVIGADILLTIAEVKQEFIETYHEFSKQLYEKILAIRPQIEEMLSIWSCIKMVTFIEAYEFYQKRDH